MKKSSIIPILAVVLMISIFTTSTVYAALPDPPAKCIREVLREAVNYPDFYPKHGGFGKVEVVFTLSDQGAIQIEDITATSDDLREYVKEVLSKTSCSKVISPYNQHYKVTFKFQVS